MTANRAEPADAGVAPPEAVPNRAEPARGSRGRHAGPTVAVQPGLVMARAVGTSRWRGALAVLRANPLATAGAAIVIAVAAFCFLGPLVYHSNETSVLLSQGNLSPRPGHPLGTDADGLDELGQVMAGGQVSLELGLAAGVLAAVLGSLWGAVAGCAGGMLDAVMMRVVDAAIAIPAVVLLLLLISIYTPSTGILVLVIAGTAWLSTARLVRAEALTLRTREYVQSVRVMGGGGFRVVLRHIAPNAVGTIAVSVTFQVASAILLLATLSYLGLGVQFPSVDWGSMIANANAYGATANGYWWEIVSPGVAIILVIAGFTMLGDGLRDWFSADA
jgi:peptide/nickel transport system permease protein